MQGVLYRVVAIVVLCVGLSTRAATPPKQKALFAVFGGYGSCGKSDNASIPGAGVPIAHAFRDAYKKLAPALKDVEVQTLFGCLHEDAPPDGLIEYVFSANPKKSLDGNTRDVRDDLEEVIKNNPGIAIYLVGHSYGGWVTMYLAETLKGTPNIKALFTVDPIGPDCTAFGLVLGDDACHRAPTDRNNKSIRKRVGQWENFYQTEDTWLTSSEIPEAINHEITFGWGPHGEMDTHDGIWTQISTVVRKTL